MVFSKFRLLHLNIIVILLMSILGCSNSSQIEKETPKHYYFVFSPTNLAQIKQIRAFMAKITDNREDIFNSGNYYTILEICSSDRSRSLLPLVELQDRRKRDNITAPIYKMLEKRQQSLNTQGITSDCEISSEDSWKAVVDVLSKISDASTSQRRGDLVAFLQVPWMADETSVDSWSQIEKQVQHFAEEDNFERLVVFGMNSESADRAAFPFSSLEDQKKVRYCS